MKTSIRTRFTVGVVFFLVIILLLSILSVIYLNMLSRKTSTILIENHYSVIYARNMAEDLTNINQELLNCSLTNKQPDSSFITKQLNNFDKSLQLEKNNITEPGEDKLAADIGNGFIRYRASVQKILKSAKETADIVYLQNNFGSLYQQLMLLSRMNEKAIEVKTNDTKVSAKNASIQMTIVGTLCFLIAFAFTFSFSSYFSERFFQLYNGIKELSSNNYGQRLHFEGNDEFYEISLVFNQMAEKLSEPNSQKTNVIDEEQEEERNFEDIRDLKMILINIKAIEKQAVDLISKLENKK